MADYDLCVIGAGPGGYAATIRAWDFGKKVCLIERGQLGGVGVHNGALSSKTLWELSRDYMGAIRRDRGYFAESVTLDFAQVAHCVETAVQEKVRQLGYQLGVLNQCGKSVATLFLCFVAIIRHFNIGGHNSFCEPGQGYIEIGVLCANTRSCACYITPNQSETIEKLYEPVS